MEELTPRFLIAMPQLGDPNFARSVVLILHHSTKGALGLVINNPTPLDLGTFARNHSFACHSNISRHPVFRGGPVDPQVGWLLHAEQKIQERRDLLPDLYISGSQESLRELIENGNQPLKLILGYAGWGAGQLEQEMAQGAWLSAGASTQHILHTDATEVWDAVLEQMGVDPTHLIVGSGVH